MKIAILGTRGIPNNYGGFEQFAEYLSLGLIASRHEVSVYNSHNHPFREKKWNGVNIIHCFDPEYKIGTAGQFIYDLNCVLDSRKRDFDVILQLGYTSSAIWNFLFPKRSVIITNMDGLEWKRSKYGRQTQRFLKYAEGLAVRKSDQLIADSIGIQKYLSAEYKVPSVFIPYGAEVFNDPDRSILTGYNVNAYGYDMLIARLEPENSVDMILSGVAASRTQRTFLIIGNHQTKYGLYLKNKFATHQFIRFLGPVYDMREVNNLRYFSNLYFHGHSVGGTNPSLLEAMASSALIAANNNEFNSRILGDDAFYFSNPEEITQIVDKIVKENGYADKLAANITKIKEIYSWQLIVSQYEELFKSSIA